MKFRRVACGLTGIALLFATLVAAPSSAAPTKIPVTAPCGASGTTQYSHVVLIMLENVGYSVVGSPSAPYFNRLAAECGLATNYLAVSHPSLPNYIALTSGSTHGITDDGEPSEHPLDTPSIFSELGSNWRTLAQSMPSACDHVTSGDYAARHNPAVYYTTIASACKRNDVPLTVPLNVSAKYTIVVPNICDDMHSCPVSTGDRWLSQYVPLILSSAQYQSRSLVLFITFDENDSDASNQVPTLVIAPSTPRGERVGARFTHYSLLKTTETLLNVPQLGLSRTASSMVTPFHL
jgi:phosphatidylinositol-3-phosphatase